MVSDSLDTSSLATCAALCHQKQYCKTFSYGDTSSRNCLLSSIGARSISVNEDLVSDQYWSVYSINEGSSKNCQSYDSSDQGPTSDCYREDRRGYKYFSSVFRESTRARDTQECSEWCHQASYCNSFAFRPESFLSTKNCYLSELAINDIQRNIHLTEDENWVLYESLDGQNCGGGSVKPLPSDDDR